MWGVDGVLGGVGGRWSGPHAVTGITMYLGMFGLGNGVQGRFCFSLNSGDWFAIHLSHILWGSYFNYSLLAVHPQPIK